MSRRWSNSPPIQARPPATPPRPIRFMGCPLCAGQLRITSDTKSAKCEACILIMPEDWAA